MSLSPSTYRYPLTLKGAGTNLNWTISAVGNNIVFQSYPVSSNTSFPTGCNLHCQYDSSTNVMSYRYICKDGTEELATLDNCNIQTSSSGQTITCPNTLGSTASNVIKDYQQKINYNVNYSWLLTLIIVIILIILIILINKNSKNNLF